MSHPAPVYARQLAALLPRGRLFDSIGANLSALLEAWSEELARVDVRASEAYAESEPTTATETLPEWEELYGLPSDGTTAERQARIAARRYKRSRTREVDYQDRLAGVLGVTPAQVDVFDLHFAGLDVERNVYRFYIYRDPVLGGSFSIGDADALLYDYSQSHTWGAVTESLEAACDDAATRCDFTPLEMSGLVGLSSGGFLLEDNSGFLAVTEV